MFHADMIPLDLIHICLAKIESGPRTEYKLDPYKYAQKTMDSTDILLIILPD